MNLFFLDLMRIGDHNTIARDIKIVSLVSSASANYYLPLLNKTWLYRFALDSCLYNVLR